MIPEPLKTFLKNLTDDEADRMWLWLDSYDQSTEAMIDYICDQHPTIVAKAHEPTAQDLHRGDH